MSPRHLEHLLSSCILPFPGSSSLAACEGEKFKSACKMQPWIIEKCAWNHLYGDGSSLVLPGALHSLHTSWAASSTTLSFNLGWFFSLGSFFWLSLHSYSSSFTSLHCPCLICLLCESVRTHTVSNSIILIPKWLEIKLVLTKLSQFPSVPLWSSHFSLDIPVLILENQSLRWVSSHKQITDSICSDLTEISLDPWES